MLGARSSPTQFYVKLYFGVGNSAVSSERFNLLPLFIIRLTITIPKIFNAQFSTLQRSL